MTWRCRLLGLVALPVLGLIVGGCASGPPMLPTSSDRPFALDVPDSAEPRVARSQEPDVKPVAHTLALPRPDLASPGSDRQVRVTVRATVNGKPIFDEEVIHGVQRRVGEIIQVSADKRPAAQARIFNEEVNQLIERELILQDAMAKLEKNPRFLDKLKQEAAKQFDKELNKLMRQAKAGSVEEVRHMLARQGVSLDTMRRQSERFFITNEYIRSRVWPRMLQIGHKDIREYYETHLNEFRTVDKVKWQHIFVAVGPERPTVAEARRFAEEILRRVHAGEDFGNFLQHDDGDSWRYRKGEGNGQRKGEVKPPELEPHLFAMRDGQVGPLVEAELGVHLFRLLKREHAGQLPFNDKIQQEILVTLRNEMAKREYRRIVQELKETAVIEINRSTGP